MSATYEPGFKPLTETEKRNIYREFLKADTRRERDAVSERLHTDYQGTPQKFNAFSYIGAVRTLYECCAPNKELMIVFLGARDAGDSNTNRSYRVYVAHQTPGYEHPEVYNITGYLIEVGIGRAARNDSMTLVIRNAYASDIAERLSQFLYQDSDSLRFRNG